MDMVRHNTLGYGEVMSKEVISGFTMLNVRFENGKEMKLGIPSSFETGAVEALGDLKDEVDQAIAAKLARFTAPVAPTQNHVAVSTHNKARNKKSPKKVTVNGPVSVAFETYLKKAGYRINPPSGGRSTVPQYVNSVESVLSEEGISWDTLKTNISSIAPKYDVGGTKEAFSAKSNRTVICALRCFEDFANIP